jgi:hypothetical protein
MAISIRTPDTRTLISTCENASSYLQIRCKTCRAGVCGDSEDGAPKAHGFLRNVECSSLDRGHERHRFVVS